MTKKQPNIAFAGTPGTGKSTLAKLLSGKEPLLRMVDCGKEAEDLGCRDEYDEELQSWIVDEDKLASKLKSRLAKGGNVLDWIHADFWPRKSIDLVVHVRASNTVLYDRYKERKYGEKKIEQNIDSEIMNDIGQEIYEWFVEEAEESGETPVQILTLESNTVEDQDENLKSLLEWVTNWRTGSSTAAGSTI